MRDSRETAWCQPPSLLFFVNIWCVSSFDAVHHINSSIHGSASDGVFMCGHNGQYCHTIGNGRRRAKSRREREHGHVSAGFLSIVSSVLSKEAATCSAWLTLSKSSYRVSH